MRLADPRLWIAVMSAGAVITLGVVDTQRVSPGPVTTVHGRIDDLEGGQNCNACHGGWRSQMSDACLECHETIQEHLETGRGLHGLLPDAEQGRCALCHSEHHGTEFNIVNALSFSLAGVEDVDAFDHGTIGFPMDGKHLELDCSECHVHASAAPLPEGARRFVGLDQNCLSCHGDPHEGALRGACADCHVQTSFDEHVFRGHEEHLDLVGGHAGLSCRDCHAEGSSHALELVTRVRNKPEARTCADCHESPHQARFVSGVAALVGERDGASCATCHAAEHTSFREDAEELQPRFHKFGGFALAAPHSGLECSACHGDPDAPFVERYPGRAANDCAACHDDPHDGQFAESRSAPNGCVDCHGRRHFDPHGFDVALHARTAMPLDGAHREADCNDCHKAPAAGGVRLFVGTPRRCEACHEDAHQSFFEPHADTLAANEAGDCAVCHKPVAFDQVLERRFDHGEWTGFELDGAHAQEACEVCHVPSDQADATGRTFGLIAALRGPLEGPGPRPCSDCHPDPHAGVFDGESLPARVEGRENCARCHGEASFRALEGGFDHGLWTGYALEGAHAGADCVACHAPLRRAAEHGRTWERAAGRRCDDCHVDPHGGQFERGERTSCARCHSPMAPFREYVFDHDEDSRFPLDEQHEQVACADCHKPEAIQTELGPLELVRYRPLGRDCVDCHGVHADRLKRKRRGF